MDFPWIWLFVSPCTFIYIYLDCCLGHGVPVPVLTESGKALRHRRSASTIASKDRISFVQERQIYFTTTETCARIEAMTGLAGQSGPLAINRTGHPPLPSPPLHHPAQLANLTRLLSSPSTQRAATVRRLRSPVSIYLAFPSCPTALFFPPLSPTHMHLRP